MDYHIDVITLPVRLTDDLHGRLAGDYSPGVDAERRSYASFIEFADADGNTWIVRERGFTSTASTNCRRI
jgi:hypothetical protein